MPFDPRTGTPTGAFQRVAAAGSLKVRVYVYITVLIFRILIIYFLIIRVCMYKTKHGTVVGTRLSGVGGERACPEQFSTQRSAGPAGDSS